MHALTNTHTHHLSIGQCVVCVDMTTMQFKVRLSPNHGDEFNTNNVRA